MMLQVIQETDFCNLSHVISNHAISTNVNQSKSKENDFLLILILF